MARLTLAKLLLLMILFEVLMVSVTEAKPFLWGSGRRRCSSSRPSGVAWVNKWHEDFSTYCRNSFSMRHWRSQHRNCKEDRIHYFQCGYGPVRYQHSNCAWSGHYENDFDDPLNYKCAHNGFITGIRSEYSGHHRDRRFGIRCCHVKGSLAHNCKITPFQNNWDQEINYRVPNGYYLVGVHSYHRDTKEDRRWRFEICQFKKCK